MSASLAAPLVAVGHRPCVRPGCGRRATTTLRFDYSERTVTLDPLGPDSEPGEYDLCLQHAARSGPPSGWTLRDRAPSHAPATESAPPVGPDRGHGVARLAAALSAVPRAVSEDAPDAAPVGTDRPVAAAMPPRPQGTARLDPLLQPSTVRPVDRHPERADRVDRHPERADRVDRPAATVRPVPLSERTPEVAVRTVPQPLRLAPDPTTTVWCADLLGGTGPRTTGAPRDGARDGLPRDVDDVGSDGGHDGGKPTLFA